MNGSSHSSTNDVFPEHASCQRLDLSFSSLAIQGMVSRNVDRAINTGLESKAKYHQL
jgi:hypothetical protein